MSLQSLVCSSSTVSRYAKYGICIKQGRYTLTSILKKSSWQRGETYPWGKKKDLKICDMSQSAVIKSKFYPIAVDVYLYTVYSCCGWRCYGLCCCGRCWVAQGAVAVKRAADVCACAVWTVVGVADFDAVVGGSLPSFHQCCWIFF